jgi:hypothetical protein
MSVRSPGEMRLRQRSFSRLLSEAGQTCRLQAFKGFNHVAALVGAAICGLSVRLTGSAGQNALRGSGRSPPKASIKPG